MNVGNILKVADAIEQATVPGLGFNMGTVYNGRGVFEDLSGHSCGTVACIAGWTLAAVEGAPDRYGTQKAMEVAAQWLGLHLDSDDNTGEAAELFLPEGFEEDIHTPAQAVRCLRNLAITGKVDWEAAMKPADPAMPTLPAPVASKITA